MCRVCRRVKSTTLVNVIQTGSKAVKLVKIRKTPKVHVFLDKSHWKKMLQIDPKGGPEFVSPTN